MAIVEGRFFSRPLLEFTVESAGGNKGLAHGGTTAMITVGKMIAREAVRVSGWELPPQRPVFVVVTVNLPFSHHRFTKDKEWQKKLLARKMLPVRTPSIEYITHVVQSILVGTVIKTSAQICAITIVKKHHEKREFLEFLVGAPTDWAELNHDIRNG